MAPAGLPFMILPISFLDPNLFWPKVLRHKLIMNYLKKYFFLIL